MERRPAKIAVGFVEQERPFASRYRVQTARYRGIIRRMGWLAIPALKGLVDWISLVL